MYCVSVNLCLYRETLLRCVDANKLLLATFHSAAAQLVQLNDSTSSDVECRPAADSLLYTQWALNQISTLGFSYIWLIDWRPSFNLTQCWLEVDNKLTISTSVVNHMSTCNQCWNIKRLFSPTNKTSNHMWAKVDNIDQRRPQNIVIVRPS